MDTKRLNKFIGISAELKAQTLILITQVDPDALGSAVALAYIIRHTNPGTKVGIAYCGAIGHPQNRAIVNRYNLKSVLTPISDIKTFEGMSLILTDSSSIDESRIPAEYRPLNPSIVIDHHRGGITTETEEQFVWVEEVGAASTLVIELGQALSMDFSEDETNLLLSLGIYTDTKALIGASPRDVEAYSSMMEKVAPETFKSLTKYPLPETYFGHLEHALSKMETQGSRLIASAGIISPDDGDNLAAIADMFIRRIGTTLVVVFGIIGNSVRISARSSDVSMSFDDFLKSRLGQKNAGAKLTPDGIGEGGAQVTFDLGFWLSNGSPETDKLREEIVCTRMRDLFLGS
jgi:nanoRNase/pAp phosphatase (c-di-AMP/oligoRNAs hydrolase)